MRIAFVSYEFAGVATGGGIGTYVRNAADMLAARGHDVEVFTSGEGGATAQPDPRVRVTAVASGRSEFRRAIVPAFTARHRALRFAVVEGPEYGADASGVAGAFPELPLVVKLHTPTFLINEMNQASLSWPQKARFMLGGLRRGRWPTPYWVYDPATDLERQHALAAAEVTAPSRAILARLTSEWRLPVNRVSHVPHPFVAAQALLAIPEATRTNRVTFVGRLELRKGVVTLAQAIPLVLARHPEVTFRIIGRSLPHPLTGVDMQSHMLRLIGSGAGSVEFVGEVPSADVPGYLAHTDICAFPSLWEASGYVCKEAMAAARGVVASSAGGMAEIVDDGRTGLLVAPGDPEVLARAILAMLDDPDSRIAMGRAARGQVTSAYAPERIGPLQEASYARAIARARDALAAPREDRCP